MYQYSLTDIAFVVPISIFVPLAVRHYLRAEAFSARFRLGVIAGGFAWMILAFFQEDVVYPMLGISRADSKIFWLAAVSGAKELSSGTWPFQSWLPLANQGYIAYLTLLHAFTGGTLYLATVINGFMGFLGGLTLARAINGLFPFKRGAAKWYLLLIFYPSVVFWTTANMKEGFVYWGGCQLLAGLIELSSNRGSGLSLMSLLGIFVAGVLRPITGMIWLSAALVASLFARKKKTWAVAATVLMPVAIVVTSNFLSLNVSDPIQLLGNLEMRYHWLNDPKFGSHIDYGPGGPTFLISGIVGILFRPFPWEISSTRFLLASVETWTCTAIMLFGWLRASSFERSYLLRDPAVLASLVISLFFCIIFTYLPNEGLLMRQRVQLIPALLVLALFPICLRNSLLEWQQRLFVSSRHGSGQEVRRRTS